MAQTHLLVGAGKMGGALLKGWLKSGLVTRKTLCILDPNPGIEAVYAIEKGAKHLTDASDIPKSIKIVILAVKPQMLDSLGPTIAAHIKDDTTVLSILAGTSLRTLRQTFPTATLIRAMPNTPSSIGEGISAVYVDPSMDTDQVALVDTLLAAAGEVVHVESEAALNAVTAISGSGPAYVFHLVETLEAAARDLGLPKDIAAQLARQTLIGSAKLLESSDESPTQLRRNVTSPNGTTQAALDELMSEAGLSRLMTQAVRAAFARAKALSGD